MSDHIAIADHRRRFTYEELGDRVARLAGGLVGSLDVRRGDRIGILAENCVEYFEYALACWWAGATVTMVNARWNIAEMREQILESEVGILLAGPRWTDMALELRDSCGCLHTVIGAGRDGTSQVLDYERLIGTSEAIDDCGLGNDEVAVIAYTGGSTGKSKGVLLTAGGIEVSILASELTIGSGGVAGKHTVLHTIPFFHMGGFAGLVKGMAFGWTNVVIERPSAEMIVAAVDEFGVNATVLVPTMLHRMLDVLERAEPGTVELPSLKLLGFGAAPITPALLRRAREHLPTVRFRQAYGMTELSSIATVLLDTELRDGSRPHLLQSVGRACPHNQIRIVDEDDREVQKGEVGEVVVRGANVMVGYLNEPELTAATLRDGWLHSGDMGYMDSDGYLYLVDRSKDMIVSGGENVYSVEVENVLCEHSDVADAAVIGVPDEEWGERVHAFVVLRKGAAVSGRELREFVAARIARYKAPHSFEFSAKLPVTQGDKVDKEELRRWWDSRISS